MATATKTKRTLANGKAGKRLLRFDKKLGRMVEVTAKYDPKAGKLVEQVVPVKDSKDTDWLKPRGVYYDQVVSLWPMVSNNAAVLPKNLARVNKLLAAKGVPQTDHDKLGRPIWNDAAHKAKYLRARGRCDLDPGYRDAAPLRFDGKVEPEDY